MPRRRRRPARPRLLTVADAAHRLGLGVKLFRKYVLPTLGATKLGRRWMITPAMLDAFLARPSDDPRIASLFEIGHRAGRRLPTTRP